MIFIIYILIFILIYVLYLGLKAAGFGIKAKKDKKKFNSKKKEISLASELKKLEELYRNKSITKKELQIAKNKILKN